MRNRKHDKVWRKYADAATLDEVASRPPCARCGGFVASDEEPVLWQGQLYHGECQVRAAERKNKGYDLIVRPDRRGLEYGYEIHRI